MLIALPNAGQNFLIEQNRICGAEHCGFVQEDRLSRAIGVRQMFQNEIESDLSFFL